MSLAIAEGLKLPKGSRFSIGAVPAAIAGVAPTLDFRPALERREIESVSLTDKLTFAGGNQGTFVGSDGYIQRAQTNAPRFTHDPLTRRSLGMLLEASGENLLLRSEEFDNASWNKVFATVTANTATAPSGTLTADTLVPNTTNSFHYVSAFASIVTATVYTYSVYVKAAGYNFVLINTPVGSINGNVGPIINLSNGTKAGFYVFDYPTQIQNAGNGWYRVSFQFTSSGTSFIIEHNVLPISLVAAYTGDGTSGVSLLGAQLNPGPLTSYIPTTTAAVTRTADSAVIDGTGVITGAYTMVEKPAGCAVISGTNINLQNGFTVERVMIFPATLTAGQITAIRAAM